MERIYGSPSGWRALMTVNHTTIGLRFMITASVFFLIGGVLAMLIRAQLAVPHAAWLDAPSYAQVFTMHGVVMMFLFAIPLIEGFALYMLPKILGARDLAFPRLSAFGYYCYVLGGAIILIALLGGAAPNSGWFMYTPLSSQPYSPGINADIWLIGVTFVEVSAVCAAIEFMTTVLKVRAAGMSLDRMPILAWYLWVTAAMMLFGFPPLILGSVLLEVERAFGWPFFDPTRGGTPLCGSTCSGYSAILKFTSFSFPPRVSSPRCCRCSAADLLSVMSGLSPQSLRSVSSASASGCTTCLRPAYRTCRSHSSRLRASWL
jgi:cytochrome c oxidase subunit I+III